MSSSEVHVVRTEVLVASIEVPTVRTEESLSPTEQRVVRSEMLGSAWRVFCPKCEVCWVRDRSR